MIRPEESPFERIKIDLNKLVDDDRCVVRDDFIILLGDYPIALNRCDTAGKLLAWVCHLAGRDRFTPVLGIFVRRAAEIHGIEIDEPISASRT